MSLSEAILENDYESVREMVCSGQAGQEEIEETLTDLIYLQGKGNYLYDLVSHFHFLAYTQPQPQ